MALSGEIGEAQWAATAALGLLYEEHKEDHPGHLNTDGLKEAKEHQKKKVHVPGSPSDPFSDRKVRDLPSTTGP